MKISVITAVYNNESHIGSAIESVLGQAQSNFELEYIIIDGASTDNTLNIVKQYEEQISTLVSEPDKGIYDALNKGIAHATGDILGFLHSDDIFENRFVLQRIAHEFTQNPELKGTYGDLKYVDQEDTDKVTRNWVSGPFEPKNLKHGWMPPHPTLYLKKEIYKQYGNFDISLKIAADYDFMMRILTDQCSPLGPPEKSGRALKGKTTDSNLNPGSPLGPLKGKSLQQPFGYAQGPRSVTAQNKFNLYYIAEPLVRMRTGGASNKSLKNIYRKSSEDLKVMRRYKIGSLWSLLAKNVRKVPQFFSTNN